MSGRDRLPDVLRGPGRGRLRRGSARSRSTRCCCAAKTSTRRSTSCGLAAITATRCASSSSCRLENDRSWDPGRVVRGSEVRGARSPRSGRSSAIPPAILHAPRIALSVRGRIGCGRIHRFRVVPVLRRVQPDQADERRKVPRLPLRRPRGRPARRAARRCSRTSGSWPSCGTRWRGRDAAARSTSWSPRPRSLSRARCIRSAARHAFARLLGYRFEKASL